MAAHFSAVKQVLPTGCEARKLLIPATALFIPDLPRLFGLCVKHGQTVEYVGSPGLPLLHKSGDRRVIHEIVEVMAGA